MNILNEMYPNGFKFTFYLIDEEGTPKKSYKGLMAAVKFLRILPISVSLYVLGAYVKQELRIRRARRVNANAGSDDVDLGRRKFAKYVALAPFLVFLPKLPFSLAESGMVSSISKKGLSAENRAKINSVIEGELAKGNPIPTEITIHDPQCVIESCSCSGPNAYCCLCSGGYCVAICQSGCGSYKTILCEELINDQNVPCAPCTSDSDCLSCFCSSTCCGAGCCDMVC